MLPISKELLAIVDRAYYKMRRRMSWLQDVEDLRSAALVALAKFCETYEGPEDRKCYVMAYKRVYWSMVDELRQLDTLSRRDRKTARLIETVPDYRDKSPEAIASATGLTVERVKYVAEQMHKETIPIEAVNIQEESNEGFEVAGFLDSLDEKDRVFLTRFFLNHEDPKAIAKSLKVTVARVYQLRDESIKRARKRLRVHAER